MVNQKKYGLWFCVALFTGCMTLPSGQIREEALTPLITVINRGDSTSLAEALAVPFLLDTEIVDTEQDLHHFWIEFLKKGFRLENPEIRSIKKIEPGDYRIFGESREIQYFFKKYLPARASLVTLVVQNRMYFFVLEKRSTGLPAVFAFKGPAI